MVTSFCGVFSPSDKKVGHKYFHIFSNLLIILSFNPISSELLVASLINHTQICAFIFFQATKGDKPLGSSEIYEEMTQDAFSKYIKRLVYIINSQIEVNLIRKDTVQSVNTELFLRAYLKYR